MKPESVAGSDLRFPARIQMDVRPISAQACILSTQQQFELPRRIHCLPLPVVVGEGRRLSGKRQRIESR
jgi:hypothetical protein